VYKTKVWALGLEALTTLKSQEESPLIITVLIDIASPPESWRDDDTTDLVVECTFSENKEFESGKIFYFARNQTP